MGTVPSDHKHRGRARGFDEATALDAAMKTFWATGHDAASVDTLCRVTALSRASLYQAIAQYVDTRITTVAAALGPHGTLTQDLAGFFCRSEGPCHRRPKHAGLPDLMRAGGSRRGRPKIPGRTGPPLFGCGNRLDQRLHLSGWHYDAPAPSKAAAGLAAATGRGIMLRARFSQSANDLASVAMAAVSALVQLSA